MKIKLSFRYTIAFLALLFVMHELHEIAHTAIGRLICGCWGKRDFNVWSLCERCGEESNIGLLATLAVPLFTFSMIWYGYSLLNKESIKLKSIGYSLIFANMPIARLLSSMLNSGDETYILRQLDIEGSLAAILASIIIFLIILIPLIKAYKTLGNDRKILWFLGFLILPLVIDLVVVLGVLNTLLDKGIFDQYWILGSPLIVSIWTFLVLGILLIMRKHLFNLAIS
jgi:hypothetical protein